MRQILVQFGKFALATGLITYFVRSGRIDLDSFKVLFNSPSLMAIIAFLIVFNIFLNNYRWLLLLKGLQIYTTIKQTLPLTFIGLFFNVAIPGSVGGDVVKALYLAREQNVSRAKAMTTVGLDRLIGLFSFILLGMIAGLCNLPKMFSIPELTSLFIFICVLFVGFIIFFILCFSSHIRTHRWTDKFLKKAPGGRIIEKLYDAVHAYKDAKGIFVAGVLLSTFAQTLFIACMYLVAEKIGMPQRWSTLFFITPLGMITMAIPISPAGVGVGQVAFHQLFMWYLGQDSTLGATLISVMQGVSIAAALAGSVFYFTRRSKIAAVKGEISGGS